MYQYDDFFDLIYSNLKGLVFPEEWLKLDIELSKQELFVITIIEKYGEITMSQLSDQMNFPMSTATGIIDRLVKKEYIIRGKSETDRRIVTISLTDKGKALMHYIRTSISQYIEKAYDALDEEERKYFFRIIMKITDALKKIEVDKTKDELEQKTIKKIEIE